MYLACLFSDMVPNSKARVQHWPWFFNKSSFNTEYDLDFGVMMSPGWGSGRPSQKSNIRRDEWLFVIKNVLHVGRLEAFASFEHLLNFICARHCNRF